MNDAESTRSTDRITLTAAEAANQLNVSKPTVLKWAHMVGGLPHFYAGRKILFPREKVIEWANRQAEARAVL